MRWIAIDREPRTTSKSKKWCVIQDSCLGIGCAFAPRTFADGRLRMRCCRSGSSWSSRATRPSRSRAGSLLARAQHRLAPSSHSLQAFLVCKLVAHRRPLRRTALSSSAISTLLLASHHAQRFGLLATAVLTRTTRNLTRENEGKLTRNSISLPVSPSFGPSSSGICSFFCSVCECVVKDSISWCCSHSLALFTRDLIAISRFELSKPSPVFN